MRLFGLTIRWTPSTMREIPPDIEVVERAQVEELRQKVRDVSAMIHHANRKTNEVRDKVRQVRSEADSLREVAVAAVQSLRNLALRTDHDMSHPYNVMPPECTRCFYVSEAERLNGKLHEHD